ncbi:hypothetical protein PTSG_01046 [Salpingoeca rosetta]|uniref:Uncharacterized protein n=1 Tax=Salpingoeca rosetta (strain ATCC 50818 / BSB-021) TaxID=946362 RepID=F2TY87_SALR5|nr:uncharacterized protein PTSG_01046 [Salpingoeca rosetta]EGD76346.1 hypothetical protein PTSG_01046 [Salpingoeca rosetta]|eukprot:XP_004998521.1 hypothetical protein PTSG_01046 [Salpingoeca rosetta]
MHANSNNSIALSAPSTAVLITAAALLAVLSSVLRILARFATASSNPAAPKQHDDDDSGDEDHVEEEEEEGEPVRYAVNALSSEEYEKQGAQYTLRCLAELRQQLFDTNRRRAAITRLSPSTSFPFIQFINGKMDIAEEHIRNSSSHKKTREQASVQRAPSPAATSSSGTNPLLCDSDTSTNNNTFGQNTRTWQLPSQSTVLDTLALAGVSALTIQAPEVVQNVMRWLLRQPIAQAIITADDGNVVSDSGPVHPWIRLWLSVWLLLLITTRSFTLSSHVLHVARRPSLWLQPLLAYARPTAIMAKHSLRMTWAADSFRTRMPGILGVVTCLLDALAFVFVPRLLLALAYAPYALPPLLSPRVHLLATAVVAAVVVSSAVTPPPAPALFDPTQHAIPWLMPASVLFSIVRTVAASCTPWPISGVAGAEAAAATTMIVGLFGHTLVSIGVCFLPLLAMAVAAACSVYHAAPYLATWLTTLAAATATTTPTMASLSPWLPQAITTCAAALESLATSTPPSSPSSPSSPTAAFVLLGLVPLAVGWTAARALTHVRMRRLVPWFAFLAAVVATAHLSSPAVHQLVNFPVVVTNAVVDNPTFAAPLVCPQPSSRVPAPPPSVALTNLCLSLACGNTTHLMHAHRFPHASATMDRRGDASSPMHACAPSAASWCRRLVDNARVLTMLDAGACDIFLRSFLSLVASAVIALWWSKNQDTSIQLSTAFLSAFTLSMLTQRPIGTSFLFFYFFQSFIAVRITQVAAFLLFDA